MQSKSIKHPSRRLRLNKKNRDYVFENCHLLTKEVAIENCDQSGDNELCGEIRGRLFIATYYGAQGAIGREGKKRWRYTRAYSIMDLPLGSREKITFGVDDRRQQWRRRRWWRGRWRSREREAAARTRLHQRRRRRRRRRWRWRLSTRAGGSLGEAVDDPPTVQRGGSAATRHEDVNLPISIT